jgi:DNA-binding transcriptional LysR family regulator
MELRHLRYFIAVAEAGSVVKAARALNLAQPALSRQIQDLERLLGVTLLERLPHGVQLTRAGKGFLNDARRTLVSAKRAATRVRAAHGTARETLRLGYGELLSNWRELAESMFLFRTAHPKVEIESQHMTGPQIRSALREDRIDVGVVGVAKWPPRGLEGARLLDAWQTGALLPAGHPVAARDKVRIADLASLTWYHLPADATLGAYECAREIFRERGLDAKRRATRPGSFAFLPQIAAGRGWAPAGRTFGAMIPTLTKAIVYRPFAEPAVLIWMAALWKKGQRADAVVDFVNIALKVCESQRHPHLPRHP